MSLFGRRPGQSDIGFGEMVPGQARGAIMGRPSANGWVYLYGGRMGKQAGSANVKYRHALYATANDTQITTLIGQSVEGTAANVMDYGGAGANLTIKAAAAVMIHSRYSYALVTRIASGYAAHGMDHSGHRLWTRTGAGSSFPSPFGTAGGSPQGKPSFWLEFAPNVAPKKPTGLSPSGTISSGTPTLAADFRDDNEALPGIPIGQADKVKKYRFEIWNSANNAKLRDSGVVNATGAQQTARRVTWANPTALPAGTYRARCTVWDQFDVPSPTAEWVFTINAGGVVTDVKWHPNHQHELDPNVTNVGVRRAWQFTWHHAGNLNATAAEARLRYATGGNAKGPTQFSVSLAPGGVQMIQTNQAILGWGDDIPEGRQYYLDVRAQDSEGLWSPWATSPRLTVNGAPNTPTNLNPPSGFVGSVRYQLIASFSDPNDPTPSLLPEFAVRQQGSSGDGLVIPLDRTEFDSRWRGYPDATEMPSLGTYEWRCRASDKWGGVGGWSAWTTFVYAAAPVVTITSPAHNATLTTGTPTVSWTADKPMQRREVRVFRHETREPVWSTEGAASGSSGSVTIPAGILRNSVEYDIEVHVTSTDGLKGSKRHIVTVQYPQPAALASLTAEMTPGPLEPDADPSQWSRIALSWAAATTAQVPDSEFLGYIVRRVNLATGESERIDGGQLAARGDTVFIDRTPTSGIAYEYQVTYLRLRNLVDTVESVPAAVQHSVTLKHTVICTIGPEDLGTPLRYWEDRSARPVREWEIVPSFGPEPIPFQGAADYLEITGTFKDIDDPYGTYLAQDVRRMVEVMGAPDRTDPERPRGRVICYRDPLQRNVLVILREVVPTDIHRHNRVEMELLFIQAGARQGKGDS